MQGRNVPRSQMGMKFELEVVRWDCFKMSVKFQVTRDEVEDGSNLEAEVNRLEEPCTWSSRAQRVHRVGRNQILTHLPSTQHTTPLTNRQLYNNGSLPAYKPHPWWSLTGPPEKSINKNKTTCLRMRVALVECMHFVFTGIPGESYCRRFGSLLPSSWDTFHTLLNSLHLLILHKHSRPHSGSHHFHIKKL